MLSHNLMYNIDHRSKEFIAGVHYSLGVAETNKQNGFMCCLCAVYKNLKEYSCSKTPSTLVKVVFRTQLYLLDEARRKEGCNG